MPSVTELERNEVKGRYVPFGLEPLLGWNLLEVVVIGIWVCSLYHAHLEHKRLQISPTKMTSVDSGQAHCRKLKTEGLMA